MAAEGEPQRHDWVVGCHVTLRTTLGEEITSTIFAYDHASQCLLLKETGSHNGVATLRFLKTSFIKEIVSSQPPQGPVDLSLPYVDLERCKKREEKALQQAELESSRVGAGVTKEAQAIFDALMKTMPCRWKDKVIVVLEEVFIDEPYTPESVRADDSNIMERVKKVLQAERQRLGY
mmetsp:Transcript_26127/g.57106  ORF Transcript_26127/g.57106 Transcript_26127/m.57106 type:complete len:177 (-) Transcript_26127:279-809(-)|eukprot:CAMPEP_0202902606 /NCGR_PEP_ID=MMETSP1392-20130828/16949_1 /ASSEMBLY_ACC=CAM_ASM_000868 /TAXON_ID=225041 /ORGANISM="Chlamydomonas chlamydogama, Strain SAG 11-48b" /LENGTH=176 /DNA_ID=CAMNT_0049589395 /DNA_START=106 /DNA_END=636 /DNA_ORIENTATION=-